MARILLILSIILTLATAGLGYMAKQKVDELQASLQTGTRDLRAKTNDLIKTKKELDATTADLTKTKTDLDDRSAELGKAKTELNDTATKLASATALVDAKTKELDDIKAQLKPPGEGPGMTAEELKIAMETSKADLAKAQSELAEARQVQETLNNRLQEQTSQLAAKEQQVKSYKDVTVRAGLSGRVLAFNPGWNFAVLSIGDKAGLKAGVNMVVTRGGSMIAKARVTTVEPNTSIADILPGSLARGATVQAGDTVVFEGNQR